MSALLATTAVKERLEVYVFTVAIVALLVASLKEVLVAATLPLIGLSNKDPLVVLAVDTERIKALADEVALIASITELAVKREMFEDVLYTKSTKLALNTKFDATILPEILLTLTVPTAFETNVTETIPAVALATVVLP
jgi:hypothetical protein